MRGKSILVIVIAVSIFISGPTTIAVEPSFQGLGFLLPDWPLSNAIAVSADGSVVAGYSQIGDGYYEAFRWTESGGMVGIGDLPGGRFQSTAGDITADGSVIVGQSESTIHREAFRWMQAGGMVGLGDLPGGALDSCANGVSDDGSVVVGSGRSGPGYEAFRWTQTSGIVGLGDLPGGSFWSVANAVSGDGSVVVGRGSSSSGAEAFRWTESDGIVSLGGGEAKDITADGTVVVGTNYGVGAFRWTESGGMESLEGLSSATAVSGDGSVVVGSALWTESRGAVLIKDLLENEFGLDLTGWALHSAYGISEDGTTVVGNG